MSDTIRHFLATEEFQRRAIDPNRVSWKILLNSSRYYQEQINRDFAASIPAGSLVLDVGAGRAPYRNLFKHAQYESADFEKVNKEYGETTYVCDVTEGIPVEDNHFDYLLSNQTLEHINEPAKALKAMHRVLKPGGMMLCSAPLFYEEHEQPYDFFRYTRYAFSHLFKQAGFEIVKLEWLEGFFGTCGYMLECMYRFIPAAVPEHGTESTWANAFLSGFRPMALMAAGAFYKMDTLWKITATGFPKSYVVHARKPAR